MQTTPVSEVPDPVDCFRLTPVNLKTLRSPLKQRPMSTEGNESLYKENFNLILKQLQNLLSELDVIYREVGYSKIEISRKEKQIFHNLSNSISKFFDEANAERDTLTKEFQTGQYTLQCMLNTINDPKGVNTIPDLFMRNNILVTSSQTMIDDNCSSPHKSSSLLNKLKILNNVKDYVMNAYLPNFMRYLSTVLKLRHLMEKVPDMQDQILPTNFALPQKELCSQFNSQIRSCGGDTKLLFKFFQEENETIFQRSFFSKITNDQIKFLESFIKSYSEEYTRRLERYKTLQNELQEISQSLGIDYRSIISSEQQYEIPTESEPVISWLAIVSLEKSIKKYEILRQTRMKEKDELLTKCQTLWGKLKVPDGQQQKFIENNSNLSAESLENIRAELDRLEEMKKKLIKKLIQDSCDKINEYFTAMSFTESEKAEFQNSFEEMSRQSQSLKDDERLLEFCESQIDDLKRKMEIFQPIWKLIQDFESLKNDKIKLDESTKDSSRLLARNSHKILLEEERARKRITRYFPSVVRELKEKLTLFEEEFGKPFLLNGEQFLDIVLQEQAELANRYPKSRINMKAPSVRLRDNTKTIPKTPSKNHVAGSMCSSTSSSLKNRVVKPMTTPIPRNSTLKKVITNRELLPPPHISVRKEFSRIPSIATTTTGSLNNSKRLATSPEPRLLAPVSNNKLNIRNSNEKEKKQPAKPLELNSLRVTREKNMINSSKTNRYMAAKLPSSPIKEPFGSVYSISRSPEGKIKLNVSCNSGNNTTNAHDNNPDSSFLNDSNFIEWKQNQVAKLNNYNDENSSWNNNIQ